MPKLRVGFFNTIDSRPVAWGFLKGHHGDLFIPSQHSPTVLAKLLAQGNLDIALLPTVDIPRIPGVRILRDICVAGRGESRGLILVSRDEPAAVTQVAVDPESSQGVTLLRLLWLERYGVELDLVPMRPNLERMLREHGAALLIGENAWRLEEGPYRIHSLGGDWEALTRLPCVGALWAVRAGINLPDLSFYFKSSLRYGKSLQENLIREAAGEQGLDPSMIRRQLEDHLTYFLREEELRGLQELYRRMAKHGLIEAEPELTFLD